MRNLTVLARNDENGFFYTGSVSTPVLARTDKIVWFRGLPPKLVSYTNVIPIAGAIPWSLLQVNDFVLTRVSGLQGDEYYVPGLVVALPRYRHEKLYTVLIYTHEHVCRERKDMVLIGKERYKLILDYIQRVANPNVHLSYQSRFSQRSKTRRGVQRTSSYSRVDVSTKKSNRRLSWQGTPTLKLPSIQPADTPDRPSQQSLPPPLSVGAEVLARFQDDGWFYFGLVTRVHEDASYDVIDSTGHTERIHGDHVIGADSCNVGSRQPGDFVLAVHPDYVLSYAPGKIRSVNRQNEASIKFFDGVVGTILCSETYKISQEKYRYVVSGINNTIISVGERDLVLRDENTGFYYKRNVTVRSSTSTSLSINDADTVREVSVCHVFYPENNTSTREIDDWKFLLAPTAEADDRYLPAKIVNRGPLMIQDCLSNDSRQLDTLEDCFYLSKMYYNNAVEFITSRQSY